MVTKSNTVPSDNPIKYDVNNKEGPFLHEKMESQLTYFSKEAEVEHCR